jgi:hypothetical protein
MGKNTSRLFLAAVFLLAITSASSAQQLTESAQRKLDGAITRIPSPKVQLAGPRPLRTAPQLADRTAAGAQSTSKSNSGGLPGILSIPNFSRAFSSRGQVWPYTMMGNDPALGRRTEIQVRIIAVSLELQNEDLVTTTKVPIAPFVRRILHSPNFREADYASGEDIQYADAIQRAEFFNVMRKNWHTELRPVRVVEHATIFVPRTIKAAVKDDKGNITQQDVQTYFTGTADDGSTFVVLLDQFFDQAFFDTVANAIGSRRLTTDALNMVLLPNTFLFSLDQGPQGNLTLGFHTFFFDGSVTPTPVWVTIFASWISPGLFGAGIEDVTGLSHEISEAINNPFVINSVPAWEFPGFPGICGGDMLEVADPIEALNHQSFPVTTGDDDRGFTYHPQIMAMRQWFEDAVPSDAIGGAYSFPDTTALTTPATPFGPLACPQTQ